MCWLGGFKGGLGGGASNRRRAAVSSLGGLARCLCGQGPSIAGYQLVCTTAAPTCLPLALPVLLLPAAGRAAGGAAVCLRECSVHRLMRVGAAGQCVCGGDLAAICNTCAGHHRLQAEQQRSRRLPPPPRQTQAGQDAPEPDEPPLLARRASHGGHAPKGISHLHHTLMTHPNDANPPLGTPTFKRATRRLTLRNSWLILFFLSPPCGSHCYPRSQHYVSAALRPHARTRGWFSFAAAALRCARRLDRSAPPSALRVGPHHQQQSSHHDPAT